MVKSTDITDEKSLRAWLKDQPREVAVWIAFRAAARVLPLCWAGMLAKDPAQNISLTVLPILRCLLVSAVAAKRPSPEIKSSAAFAVQNVTAAQNRTSHAVTAFTNAARAANEEQFIEVVSDCAASINRAMSGILLWDGKSFGTGECFSSIARDAKEITNGYVPDALPLWPDRAGPLAKEWAQIKELLGESSDLPEWQFWIDWYDAQLAGRTMLPDPKRTWDMLEQIATEITPETWDAGPETVNPEIRKIWEKFQPKDEGRDQVEFRSALSKIPVELKELENELEKIRSKILAENEKITNLKADAEKTQDQIRDWMSDIQKQFDEKIKAAVEALEQQNILKEPIELWRIKENEHKVQKATAYKHFIWSLISLAVLVIVSLLSMIWFNASFSSLMAGPGCDSDAASENCSSFSVFGLLPLATVLTLITLLLWFSRLKMKEYLSERHLMLDAREKQAFAEAYIQLVSSGDSGDEINDQRAIVYSALFRPSSDGLVKDDGGLDPSIAAAISKLLAR